MSTETIYLATLVRKLHLLIRSHVHADIRAAGFEDLTAAHLYVLQTPGPEGARPTELAARSNMTKQAMNHLLAGLEDGGYLTRVPAPGDGRGKVLRLTVRGKTATRVMQQSVKRLEQNWAKSIGTQRIDQLRVSLTDLNDLGDAKDA